MEVTMTLVEVGAYSERQYEKHDKSLDTFRSRGFTLKRGNDIIYGEMTGELASKNRDTQYQLGAQYVVKGTWHKRAWKDPRDNTERNGCTLYITDIIKL